MSKPDDDVKMLLHSMLGRFMKDHMADRILMSLDEIMSDEVDACEFVRLMQVWLACK